MSSWSSIDVAEILLKWANFHCCKNYLFPVSQVPAHGQENSCLFLSLWCWYHHKRLPQHTLVKLCGWAVPLIYGSSATVLPVEEKDYHTIHMAPYSEENFSHFLFFPFLFGIHITFYSLLYVFTINAWGFYTVLVQSKDCANTKWSTTILKVTSITQSVIRELK